MVEWWSGVWIAMDSFGTLLERTLGLRVAPNTSRIWDILSDQRPLLSILNYKHSLPRLPTYLALFCISAFLLFLYSFTAPRLPQSHQVLLYDNPPRQYQPSQKSLYSAF